MYWYVPRYCFRSRWDALLRLAALSISRFAVLKECLVGSGESHRKSCSRLIIENEVQDEQVEIRSER